jgi:hypothetical protein
MIISFRKARIKKATIKGINKTMHAMQSMERVFVLLLRPFAPFELSVRSTEEGIVNTDISRG